MNTNFNENKRRTQLKHERNKQNKLHREHL